jgi:hypothetical protein
MINYEIKSQLAKLLATEDIIVENKNVETACFDVERRVLTLPMWKRASNVVYDMLVGHEVGHALYTPNEDWEKKLKIPMTFVNVVEDVRIEKLMKRKYAGLAKSFYGGYKELSDQDFFCLEGEDIPNMNLADRVNLYYKIGNFVDVEFTEEEKDIVNIIGQTETFADVLEAAKMLYDYCKQEVNKEEQEDIPAPKTEPGGSHNAPSEATGSSEETKENGSPTQTVVQEPEVTTDKMFEENIKDFNGKLDGVENRYCEMPDVDLDLHVIPTTTIHQVISRHWKEQEVPLYYQRSDGETVTVRGDFTDPDKAYNEFKKSSSKEVNYLVKEFECKKSADAYARAAESKTGTLDCTKLHTYKYSEDIFKKVTVIPDGKSHGLIFVLDWSGSMGDYLLDTLKQLYNLLWFCKKVGIPFDVYAFTNSYHRDDVDVEVMAVENQFAISKQFSLMHFFTNKCSKKDFDQQMLNIWRIAYAYSNYPHYNIPPSLQLSGTPLNESLVCLHKIIPAFKKKNSLQKVQCVILTDGETAPLPTYRWIKQHFKTSEETLYPRGLTANSYLRNRKTGCVSYLGYEYWRFTDALLEDLKQTFPDTNFIGIRLVASREFGQFIRKYGVVDDDMMKKSKKDKSFFIKDSGYDSYIAMISNALSNDTEFEVEENASKTKIKSAFAKSLKSKSLNKKVLSHFIDLVS